MAKLAAVSSVAAVCSLVLVAGLADWAQSGPWPLVDSNTGATGHLQPGWMFAGRVPLEQAALLPINSQSNRFKRQSSGSDAAAPNNENVNKKKKKRKNNKKNKNRRLLAECLEAHNNFRRKHNVPDLEWSEKVGAVERTS